MAAPKTPALAATLSLSDAFTVDLPEVKTSRGTTSPFTSKFDSLETGAMFAVTGKDKKAVASIVSNANRKNKVQKRDANGNPLYKMTSLSGQDGSVTSVPDINKPIYEFTKHFTTIEVTPEIAASLKGTPGEGASVLVKRDI